MNSMHGYRSWHGADARVEYGDWREQAAGRAPEESDEGPCEGCMEGLGIVECSAHPWAAPTRPLRARLLATLLGALAIGGLASGCGASAVQIHTTAIQVVATVHDGAAEVAEVALSSELRACSDVPCVDAVQSRWAPVELASAAILAALGTWVVALDVVRATGADDAPGAIWRAALRAVESLARAWTRLVEAGRAVGVTLPALPPIVMQVMQAAAVMGGAS